MDIDKYGSGNVFNWDHNHLVSVLTDGHTAIAQNKRLVEAIRLIKREDFVPDEFVEEAYIDKDIEIGFEQTISKPTETIKLINLLQLELGDKVLDIGTGTGWSATIMGYVVGDEGNVYSLDRLQYLLEQARFNSDKYKEINNIEFIFRNGFKGYADKSPYDAIHISVVYDEIPDEIKNQIAVGGRLVAPTKDMNFIQITREDANRWTERNFPGVIFDKVEKGVA